MGLATRIIPVLLWGEHGAVKGRGFDHRNIGSIDDRIRVLERRNVDELILLDVSATPNGRSIRAGELKRLCQNLFMPLTVGGGVRTEDDFRQLLASGADKVAINTAALIEPDLIDRFAKKFGSQAVVISIDVAEDLVRNYCGQVRTNANPIGWAKEVEDRGAGEILLTSIDRDGTMTGYDLDLIELVSEYVDIPVICAGGCGSYVHIEQALNAGAHAAAVGAMFQFMDATPRGAAKYLNQQGFSVRL